MPYGKDKYYKAVLHVSEWHGNFQLLSPIEVRLSKLVIHIPVGDEIAELFVESDRYTPGKGNADIRRMSNEYLVHGKRKLLCIPKFQIF